jgi:hypothetical protein
LSLIFFLWALQIQPGLIDLDGQLSLNGLEYVQCGSENKELDLLEGNLDLLGKNLDASGAEILMAARPNPYNRGNCFQWKQCLGETIGNMWVDSPDYCGPLGGKSWKGQDGVCIDLMETPWGIDPRAAPPLKR